MKKVKNIFDSVVHGADLDTEATPGHPLLEVIGDFRVIIENHNGITIYQETQINVQVCYGEIQVCGCDLNIMQMTKTRIVIMGKISSILLCKGGNSK